MRYVIKFQRTWRIIILLGVQIFYSFGQDVVPRFPIYYSNSSNVYCQKDSLLLEQGLKEKVLWAMQMWDSSVKSGVGIVSGTLMQYGDFDECLAVREPIKAKYCLLTVTLLRASSYNSTDPFTIDYSPYVPVWEKLNDRGVISKQKNNIIDWALCVPSSCKEEDILESLNEFIFQENLNTSISLSFSQRACSLIDDNKFSFGDFAFCFFIGIYTIFIMLVTIYDFKCFERVEEKPSNVLLCFSLRRSVSSLMKLNPPINKYKMDILSGLYLIPMFMIVFGHRFGMFQIGGMSNYYFVEKAFKYPAFSMWTGHIDIMVDCFFTLSGFMTGVLLPYYYENLKPNFLKVILNRYIRLAPSLLVVIFFYATVYNKTGDGPLWNSVLFNEKQFCVENWWTTILFIGNYVNTERYCMVHTWYLFCDFQLFLICSSVFYLGKSHPALIKFFITVLIALCMIASFYGTYSSNLTAYSLFYKRMWENIHAYDYFKNFYIKTHFKGAPYLVGFIVGYVFYLRKPTKLSKGETKSLLLGGSLILFMAYTSGSLFSNPAHFRLGYPAAIYASLCNVIWATGLLMIIISLLIGSANLVTKIFSWSFLVPLSKLTYNGYLVHMIFQIHSAASRRVPGYISPSEWVSRTISDLVLVLFVAFFLNITVESPFRYFVKYLMFSKEKAKENTPL